MYVLDREAAEEDAQKYISRCGELIRKILYAFAVGPKRYILENIASMTGEDILVRFFYGFGLAPIQDTYFSEVEGFLHVDILELIKHTFIQGYQYAAGKDIPVIQVEGFIKLSNIFTELTAGLEGYIYMQKSGRLIEDNILELISDRYAHAVALVKARSFFSTSVVFAKQIDPNSKGITPRILYTLAGVTNGYIMQLIREGKLPAEKRDGLWYISTLDALTWLKNRDNCPDWVKKL